MIGLYIVICNTHIHPYSDRTRPVGGFREYLLAYLYYVRAWLATSKFYFHITLYVISARILFNIIEN